MPDRPIQIIDTFCFFKELDVLEIRLKYLYPYVDKFIILEFSQTFSGQDKTFVLDENFERFKAFQDKIIYIKHDQKISSFEELQKFLINKNNKISNMILENIKNDSSFNKFDLNWLRDAYQKECILYPLYELNLNSNDIVFMPDLDEIPSINLLKKLRDNKEMINEIYVTYHYNFNYKLNLLSDELWKGAMFSNWTNMQKGRMNYLRWDYRALHQIVKPYSKKYVGYHFSFIGTNEFIKNKIQSYAHQELNNTFVMSRLENIIDNGIDLLFGKFYKPIEIKNGEIYDESMYNIIKEYDQLTVKKFSSNIIFKFFYKYIIKIFIKLYWYKSKVRNVTLLLRNKIF